MEPLCSICNAYKVYAVLMKTSKRPLLNCTSLILSVPKSLTSIYLHTVNAIIIYLINQIFMSFTLLHLVGRYLKMWTFHFLSSDRGLDHVIFNWH